MGNQVGLKFDGDTRDAGFLILLQFFFLRNAATKERLHEY